MIHPHPHTSLNIATYRPNSFCTLELHKNNAIFASVATEFGPELEKGDCRTCLFGPAVSGWLWVVKKRACAAAQAPDFRLITGSTYSSPCDFHHYYGQSLSSTGPSSTAWTESHRP